MENNRENLRFKSPRPESELHHKKALVSFSRDQGDSTKTEIGELMVSTDATGMSLVWIQFYLEGKWDLIYLKEENVRSLKNSGSSEYAFIIESILTLNAKDS